MAHPIWKDYYVNLGTTDFAAYRIYSGTTLIYNGRAVKRPGAASIQIRINDICADYLRQSMPALSHFSFMSEGIYISVMVYRNSAWEKIDEVHFLADWSYEGSNVGMSMPINRRLSPHQWLLYSSGEAKTIILTTESPKGQTSTYSIPAAAPGVAVIDLNQYSLQSIVVDGMRYQITDGCERYCLYYINAHGGWDSFLIEGNHAESDTISRHNHSSEYDNRDSINRGRVNYANEIVKKMTLHTSWLSDEESSRMHHLLNATQVYLFDIAEQKMIPVLLTNTTAEYKTYKGNGGKLVNYVIDVEFANERVRR